MCHMWNGWYRQVVSYRMFSFCTQRCMLCHFSDRVAAFNVNGRTLHSLLKMPLNFMASNELRGPALQNLQEQLKQCCYLIIDEVSMLVDVS